MRTTRPLLALVLLPFAALPASAHHGWSGYDASRLVTLTGTARSFVYESPHALLTLATPDGKLWEIVLAPPSRMARRGLDATGIKAGETVTVAGYPHRTDPDEFRAERLTVASTTYELR